MRISSGAGAVVGMGRPESRDNLAGASGVSDHDKRFIGHSNPDPDPDLTLTLTLIPTPTPTPTLTLTLTLTQTQNQTQTLNQNQTLTQTLQEAQEVCFEPVPITAARRLMVNARGRGRAGQMRQGVGRRA
jgi:hypothetical protein